MTRARQSCMPFAMALLFAGACGFSGDGPPGDDGDDTSTPGLWRLDSEADFRAAGAWLDDATTITPGSLAVGRYAHGALAAAGRAGCGMGPGQAGSMAWGDVVATAATGRGFGAPNLPMTGAVPAGLGLAGADAFTAWWEGDVWLESGTHAFAIDADDRAFLEVATPDGAWQRVAGEATGTGTIAVPATAWYPVRIALAECGGTEAFAIRHQAPGASDAIPLSETRLRAPVYGQTGLATIAFDDRAMLVPVGMSAAASINADWSTGHPADLGITVSNTYSLRWSGQVRIDVAGAYRFRVASDNGHRLRIDGVVVLDHMSYGAVTEDRTSTDVTLAAGWHDLVLDYQEDAGSARIALTVAAGPELAGQAIPADRLRPMPGPVGRVVARAEAFTTMVPDHMTRSFPVRLDAPPGATVDRVNVGYTITHAYPDELVVRLVSPQGTVLVLRDRQGGPSPLQDRFITTGEFDGQPAAGTWTLEVEDQVTNDTGMVRSAALTLHYSGGAPAQPAQATYLSAVRDLGDVSDFEALRWEATTPGASTVALAIRTCATADGCVGEFVPVPASGGLPAVPALPFAQLRATLVPAGDDAPTIEAIELEYRP